MEQTAPLPNGTRVVHYSQQWAYGLPSGTAGIIGCEGPYSDGSWEYLVRTGREFSFRPGPDNPQDCETWWSSLAVRPARQPAGERLASR